MHYWHVSAGNYSLGQALYLIESIPDLCLLSNLDACLLCTQWVFMHDLHVIAESYSRVRNILSGYLCTICTSVLSFSAVYIIYSVGSYE